MSALPASRTVASFDSASAMHAATVAALNGSPFPNLGQGRAAGLGARLGGQLPWPVLKRVYARIGAGEGLTQSQLARVDLAAVAEWLADAYPSRRYPGVLLGSSNGALTQLAAAAQIPWLPGTLLVPVRRNADVNDLDAALGFGIRHAPTLTAANPDIVVHHMHDQMQDELMAARMAYFRIKWRTLSAGYRRFLSERLQPGAPVIILNDTSTWPVVRVSDQHVFQPGAHGVRSPGIATPADWSQVLGRHGITAHFPGLDVRKFPHDVAFMGRYDTHLEQLTPARRLWSPLPIDVAVRQLRAAGLSIT